MPWNKHINGLKNLWFRRKVSAKDRSGGRPPSRLRAWLGVEALERRDLLSTLNLGPQPLLVAAGNYSLNAAQFAVTLSSPNTQTISVNYGTSDGTAVAGVDYTATGGTLTFLPGQSSESFSVPVLSDGINALNKTFSVTLSNPQGPTGTAIVTGQATATILDDVVPSLWVESPTVTKGVGTVTVNVHLTEAYSQPITVYCATAGNTTTTLLTFQPGQTVAGFTVPIADNGIPGPTSTIAVSVSAAAANLAGTNRNHDFIYQIYSDVLRRPADAVGLGNLTKAMNQGETSLQVANGVLAGNEYRTSLVQGYYASYLGRAATAAELNSWLGKYPGQEAVQTSILASSEFFADAGNTNSGFIQAVYQDVLNRSPSSSELATWLADLAAGTTRSQVASMVVTGNEARSLVITYFYQSLLRRLPSTQELTNWLNQLNAAHPIAIENVKAALLGSSEYFGRMLGSTAQGTITVLDDNSTVSIQATTPSVSESGSGPGVFTITRAGDDSADLAVSYTLQGTAQSGRDFVAPPSFVVIPAGSYSATVNINLLDDGVPRAAKTVTVTLTWRGSPGYKVSSQSGQATLSITNSNPGLVVTPQTGNAIQLTESGVIDAYSVALSVQPTSYVSVGINAETSLWVDDDGGASQWAAFTLGFTPSDWNIPQVVTVGALQDSNAGRMHLGTVTMPVESPDPNYQGLTQTVTAQIDNVQPGDFNGDGSPDLVQIDVQDGTLQLALSSGTTLTNPAPTAVPSLANWTDILVADVNGDGRDDVVGRDRTTGAWQVALSTGTSFVVQNWQGAWDPTAAWTDVVVGDFTGDGRQDIAARNPVTGAWEVAISTGTQFVSSSWGGNWSPGVTYSDVVVGDFDGDGRDEIAGLDPAGNWVVALSTGTTFVTQTWGNWDPTVAWTDVRVGDFSGDGKDDIVGRRSSDGLLQMAVSTGAGFVNEAWGTAPTDWAAVQAVDLNQDGRTDLIGQPTPGGPWSSVFLSTGTAFLPQQTWAQPDGTPFYTALTWRGATVVDFGEPARATLQAFNQVRNTIAMQFYQGFMKGTQATLETQAGNDWEQAAAVRGC